MNSLERRLQLGLGLALVILFGVLWLLGNHSIRGLTEEFVVSRLGHDAESVLAAHRSRRPHDWAGVRHTESDGHDASPPGSPT